jgi:aminoglycoside phosphotransferase (APT) family kinase protein
MDQANSAGMDEFADRLRQAVIRHIGPPGTLHRLQRLTGGANRTTWSFDADVEGRRQEFILQLTTDVTDPVGNLTAQLSSEQCARLMMAAAAGGVPAPPVRAIMKAADHLGDGCITERVAGETLGPRIIRDEKLATARALMARQCGQALAVLHRIEPKSVPFLMQQDAAEQVEAHRRIIDHFNFRLPGLEFGLRWAAENVPPKTAPAVVHGDFRTGNLIVGEEGLRCILDWELAQTGDPMQDLGWLCVKTWRFGGQQAVGGFGSREDLFAAYEKAGGTPVDPARVRFWEAFGNVKWAIDCLRLAKRGVEEGSLERSAIGRRIEEPLWDFLNLIEGRDQ